MSVNLRPENILVNLPDTEVSYNARQGETVEQLLARVTEAHSDLTSIVLVALPASGKTVDPAERERQAAFDAAEESERRYQDRNRRKPDPLYPV